MTELIPNVLAERYASAPLVDSNEQRERVTRHDVKARIEEFAALAGSEHIHKGMTSRVREGCRRSSHSS